MATGCLARVRRQPWLLGLIIPAAALLILIFCNSFGLYSSSYILPSDPSDQEAPGPESVPEPLPEAAATCKAGPEFEQKLLDVREQRQFPEFLTSAWSSAVPDMAGVKRKVAASIALHPPKYYAMVMFLTDWLTCPGAFQALSVYVVFQYQKDLDLFREAVHCLIPGLPELWVPVVASTPKNGWPKAFSMGNQYIAAYKKFFGLAAMMDLGHEDYGLIMDSELSIYDLHTEGGGDACGPDGHWSRFLARIQAFEAKKAWPGSRVSSTLVTYDFGSFVKSGKEYDTHLLKENARYIVDKARCKEVGCQKVEHQIKHAIWTWWTELPLTRLAVVQRLVLHLRHTGSTKSWRQLFQQVSWPRFEHVMYQMWCVVHEGWDIEDVTNLTLEAKWGSYMEDPLDHSRLADLHPMWASSTAVRRAEKGEIKAFSTEEPPLLIFHADKEDLRYSSGGPRYKELWEDLLLKLLKVNKRDDYSSENIH